MKRPPNWNRRPLLCRLGIHRPTASLDPHAFYYRACLRCGYVWWTP
jgi:hypothetical protein